MPSAELTPIEVWSLILEESRKVINPQTFKTWLEPTEAIALSDDRLLVSVKNQFAVDYIEGYAPAAAPQNGDAAHFNNLIAFMTTNSLAVGSNYAWVQTQMEVDTWIDYKASETF